MVASMQEAASNILPTADCRLLRGYERLPRCSCLHGIIAQNRMEPADACRICERRRKWCRT